jgi:hypothetical protein
MTVTAQIVVTVIAVVVPLAATLFGVWLGGELQMRKYERQRKRREAV